MATKSNRNRADEILRMVRDDVGPLKRPLAEAALSLRLRRIREQYTESIEHLFDLLPAAWALDDGEFEELLQVPPGWLKSYRMHEVKPNEHAWERLQRLFAFHQAMRLVVRPGGYSQWLRRPWQPKSLIGRRSPLQAILEDGDSALDLIGQLCRTQ